MTAQTIPEVLHAATRVIAFATGKGGVGKTSISSNLAAILAAGGFRVCLVVMDPQDNAGENLGYTQNGGGDDGTVLFEALINGAELHPTVTQVRPNLDVINSGQRAGEDLAIAIRINEISDERLAQALVPLADDYDFILIDCPPFSTILQRQALAAAQWVLVPCQSDDSSFKGISLLAAEFAQARDANPDLQVLGFVLFDVDANATRMKADVREYLERELDGLAPVFNSTIRHAASPATASRRRGLVATELAGMVQDRLKVARGEEKDNGVAQSATKLAEDYVSLTREVLDTISTQEAGA